MSQYYYFDIKVHPIEEMSTNVTINEIVTFLHGLDAFHSRELALGFPEKKGKNFGGIIRVFSTSLAAIEELMRGITKATLIRDYCSLGEASGIDCAKVKSWKAYCRYRVPTRKSDRNGGQLHERRKAYAQNLPYFFLGSKSNEATFMLRIEELHSQSPERSTFNPNSYGLGSMSNPVWLPEVV